MAGRGVRPGALRPGRAARQRPLIDRRPDPGRRTCRSGSGRRPRTGSRPARGRGGPGAPVQRARHHGAESGQALAARVRDSLQRIAAEHAGGRVVVVTHGGVIAQALALATGSAPFAFLLSSGNGSLSQAVRAGERWVVRRFNDTAHLADDLSRVGVPLT
ncbi:histidine phosphatase family protein [Geodermatophilus sp. TF02-6]|uniref:histidine phosphatase family protein n=1 Tax=Geodermatophilus sp. TF02-6 TaxID=2250575 RepID=UPI0018F53DEF|nr:histidine phosphatase family protein [Geodermatophilus sp. TF02-6]